MRNYSPLLSVIVPVYNVEEYVAECLRSILNQDYTNVEVIVVNDGSTDRSAQAIEKLVENNPQVHLYNKPNGGLSSARNMGLDKASGDFITFVDADDVLIGTTLYSQIIQYFTDDEELDTVQFDVIHKWKSLMEHKREYPFKAYSNRKEIIEGYLRQYIHVSCCDKVFRRSVFNDVRFPDSTICEDILIIPSLMKQMRKLQTTCVGYYGYRYREGSISTSQLTSFKIITILKAYYIYYSYAYQIGLKALSLECYTQMMWGYCSTMRQYHEEELYGFFQKDVFLRVKWWEWLFLVTKIKKSLLLKSFVACVLGPERVVGLQRLFTR